MRQRRSCADLQGRRTAPMLSRNDRQALEKLLPAIVGALGSEPFTSRDLPDAAGVRVVRGLSVDPPAAVTRRGRADRRLGC